jgi:hypothetical protein
MTHAVAIALTPPEQRLLVRAVRELTEREGPSQAAADVVWMVEHALDVRAVDGLRPDTVPEHVVGLA